MEDMARNGQGKGGGSRPFGYDKDRVTIRESEAELIREAATRVLAGEGLRSVVKDFERRGIRTVSGTE
jgi:site-specific DNA recombinase